MFRKPDIVIDKPLSRGNSRASKYQDIFDREVERLHKWLMSNYEYKLTVETSFDLGITYRRKPLGEIRRYPPEKLVVVRCPPPDTLIDLSVFLHEIAHAYHGDILHRHEDLEPIEVLRQERKASRFAIDFLQDLGFDLMHVVPILEDCYQSYIDGYGLGFDTVEPLC